MSDSENTISGLLADVQRNKDGASARLLTAIYEQLRTMAKARRRAVPSMNTTSLVHEAYIRVFEHPVSVNFESRRNFLYAAGRAMRDLLVDKARALSRIKRGGKMARKSLDEIGDMTAAAADELLTLHDELARLEVTSPRAARVVELRFFAGLSHVETAEVLGVAEATVRREWTFARAVLRRKLKNLDRK